MGRDQGSAGQGPAIRTRQALDRQFSYVYKYQLVTQVEQIESSSASITISCIPVCCAQQRKTLTVGGSEVSTYFLRTQPSITASPEKGQSFPEGILLHLFMVPAEMPVSINRLSGSEDKSPLTGHNHPTLHIDPS